MPLDSSLPSTEKDIWDKVKQMVGHHETTLGRHWSYNLWQDPKRFAFVLSRYKFAAKMGGRHRSILELGCSEGIGIPILAEFATHYTGVDLDQSAIESARINWPNDKYTFYEGSFLNQTYGQFDTVVSLDVIEHIFLEQEADFFHTIANNLNENGLAIVGTPNITSAPYASPASQVGHVNMYDHARLKQTMERLFHNVFMFGINDELVHTGYAPMAHYLIAVGCNKRQEGYTHG